MADKFKRSLRKFLNGFNKISSNFDELPMNVYQAYSCKPNTDSMLCTSKVKPENALFRSRFPLLWMHRLFIATLLMCSCHYLNAQPDAIDSLSRAFQNIKNDSLLISKLNEAATFYRNRDADLHLYVIQLGRSTAVALKDGKKEAGFIRELGIYYRKKGNLDSAIINYELSLDIHESLKDSFNIHVVKSSLANALKAKGDYQSAIAFFNEAVAYFESKGEPSKMRKLITQFNLAGVYMEMKEWATADRLLEQLFFEPAIKGNSALLRAVAINLCAIKQEMNQLDEALSYARTAEGLDNNPRSLADLNVNIGAIFEKKQEYDKAYEYFLKGLNQYKELDSKMGIILTYNNLGNVATCLKKHQQAETYLVEAEKLLQESKSLKSLSHNQQIFAELYEKMGNHQKSLTYLKNNIALNDSILGMEKQEAIAQLEVKFETEKVKKDKELLERKSKLLLLENQKNRSLLTAYLLIIASLVVAGYFYITRLKAKKEASFAALELQETERRLILEKQYISAELKALKSQMNPHFIFNVLNSVQEYIISNNKTEASEYLGRFADLIRRYLRQSDLEYITIEEEVDSLRTYLSLEALRFEDSFVYDISLSEGLEYYIPTMLVQPFVENAITHGLLHKQGKRNLDISFTKGTGDTILCTIEDNGVGRTYARQMKANQNNQHQSFSMAAIEERLQLYSEKMGARTSYQIIDLEEEKAATGTKVLLTLPIKQLS